MLISRPGLVRPVRLDPTGKKGPTRAQARGPGWRRTSHGFYVPSSVNASDVDQRIVEASAVVPPGGAITGWAALRWRGARWFTGLDAAGNPLPITILIGTHDIRPQPGLVPCGEGTHLVEYVDGLPVTTAAWTVSFLMRYASTPRTAVKEFDMAAYSDLVSIAEVAELIGHQSSWTGVPQARWAMGHVSENSWSPAEVFMRLSWSIDAGFPVPEPNLPLFDRKGRHLGTPDLVDPDAGVIGEYEGPDHLQRDRRRGDIGREEVFRAHGLEIVTQVAGDRGEEFGARLAGAYRRAAARTGPRLWTAEPPPWWTSTRSVEQPRALGADQRERLLRYRAA
jgi:hypothetical protein